jgi:AraC family transcriptional activator of tynA and feaB
VKTLFSTNEVHPRDRFDYWQSVARASLVDHNSWTECRRAFNAEIQAGALANIEIVLFENSPMDVAHTSHHVSQAKTDDLFVCRQVAGKLELEQHGNNVLLESGDIALLDPMLPYVGRFSSGSKLLVLKVPRPSLEARIGNIRQMVARSIKPLNAESRLTSSFLAMLPPSAGNMSAIAEETVSNQTLDLIAISLSSGLENHEPRVSSAKAIASLNVRAAVEMRLSDPALDAKTVADAAGLSVRYANAVLADEDTSIMRLIQAKRLARCRSALADPLQTYRTVSEIAYGWGFSDMTHFGRRFKKAYGILPSECRALAKRRISQKMNPSSTRNAHSVRKLSQRRV